MSREITGQMLFYFYNPAGIDIISVCKIMLSHQKSKINYEWIKMFFHLSGIFLVFEIISVCQIMLSHQKSKINYECSKMFFHLNNE